MVTADEAENLINDGWLYVDTLPTPVSSFYDKCGSALNTKATIQVHGARVKIDRLLDKMTEDLEKLAKLLALIEK